MTDQVDLLLDPMEDDAGETPRRAVEALLLSVHEGVDSAAAAVVRTMAELCLPSRTPGSLTGVVRESLDSLIVAVHLGTCADLEEVAETLKMEYLKLREVGRQRGPSRDGGFAREGGPNRASQHLRTGNVGDGLRQES